jgi:hypothetical protein
MCRSLVHIIIQSGIPTTLVGVRLHTYLHKQHARSVMGPPSGPKLQQDHIRLIDSNISKHSLGSAGGYRILGFLQRTPGKDVLGNSMKSHFDEAKLLSQLGFACVVQQSN